MWTANEAAHIVAQIEPQFGTSVCLLISEYAIERPPHGNEIREAALAYFSQQTKSILPNRWMNHAAEWSNTFTLNPSNVPYWIDDNSDFIFEFSTRYRKQNGLTGTAEATLQSRCNNAATLKRTLVALDESVSKTLNHLCVVAQEDIDWKALASLCLSLPRVTAISISLTQSEDEDTRDDESIRSDFLTFLATVPLTLIVLILFDNGSSFLHKPFTRQELKITSAPNAYTTVLIHSSQQSSTNKKLVNLDNDQRYIIMRMRYM